MSIPQRTKQGDKGTAVKLWQEFLNANGFDVGKPDGVHGPGTEKASLAYEAAQKKPAAATPAPTPKAGKITYTASQKKSIDAVLAIFETGRVPTPDSYATCTVLKDGAGISYGKHQCTDKAGSLDLVCKRYIALGGTLAGELQKYMNYLATSESSKVNPSGPFPAWLNELIGLLKKAGKDPIMQQAQDEVFDEVYFAPAVKHAESFGLTQALSLLVIYDTCIHSGPGRVATHKAAVKEPTPAAGGNEEKWVKEYLAVRRAWLAASTNPLVQKCVYRQDALTKLLDEGNWPLKTPFVCRGHTVNDLPMV